MILTVAAFYILNDLFAAHITKVHVYIRHGYALRVEEALKEQGIFKWVNIRNTQQVGHNTACRRASTRTNGNILAASIIYKIPYNKEIAVKAHGMNNPKLVLQTITDFLGFLRIMGWKIILTQLSQILLVRHPLRQWEQWQMAIFKIKLHMTALSNFYRI